MIPKVKICGLKRVEDVEYVNEAGADYAGFVFFEKSHRNVTYEQARELLSRLDKNIKSVAVCVSPDAEAIKRMAELGFDRIQIHGVFPEKIPWKMQSMPGQTTDIPIGTKDAQTEAPDIRTMTADAGGIPLWRAVNLSFDREPEGDPARNGDSGQPAKNNGGPKQPRENRFGAAAYSVLQMAAEHPDVAGFVIDGAKYGGGCTFGWEQDEPGWRALAQSLRQIAAGRRLILAGGLTADNVSRGIRIFEPDIVDVSSGVETDGVKDREKIHQFIREVRGK